MPEKRERTEESANDSDDEMEAEFDDGNNKQGTNSDEDKTEAMSMSVAMTEGKDLVNKTKNKNKSHFSNELIAQYYSRLFPFHLLHEWLSYNTNTASENNSNNKTFTHREFSFTIEPSPGEEIYIRYQSFKDQAELTAAVIKRNPRKIDIGAVFSHPPKDHHAIQGSTQRKFAPAQRELVFDVDLTDYDCVRKCGCSEANICLKCWKMMGMAIKVMDQGLKEDFGFKNIAWFYSGRRGVHAWICDESARKLSDAGRSAVATYFEVNLGTDKNQNVELYTPLHPTLTRAYKILEPLFIRDIIPAGAHAILASEDHWTELLDTLPTSANAVRDSLVKKWKKEMSSPEEKWLELKRYLDVLIGKNKLEKKFKQAKAMGAADKSKIELWPVATVFRYTYPRLDINVSKMQNHLLKSPFCVHPKTGRVCVPIDTKKVDEFDPFEVPTLTQLMEELEAYETSDGENVEYEWQKTSLKESFGHFQKDFLLPMWKDMKRGEKDKAEQQAAISIDF
eukprot:scaffold1542_cov251-Chaetoceros_neogracile.AAC.4